MPLEAWLERNVRAVDGDPSLRAYAVILSLLHALTGLAWFTYKNIATLVTGEDCVCWPLFPSCADVRAHLSPDFVRGAVAIYIGLGLAAALLFARRRARTAWATFVLATLAGTALYALDYRLRFNQTYMFAWVVLAFLVAPRKKDAIQILVALFYAWAGTLKLNTEWTSGHALYETPYLVPVALVPAACVYVLVLEMLLVWGLFSSRPTVRWAVYAQLIVFHAVSWKVVGYFYPLLMLGLTAIYPLVWRHEPRSGLTLERMRCDRTTRATVLAVTATFSAFQLVPYLFPGDTAITGEGRLFALHMFDAKVECEGGATLRSAAGNIARAALINEHADLRSRCDPITLLANAQRLCRALAGRRDVTGVDVTIHAKRSGDPAMRPLFVVGDFCNQPVRYSLWHHNAWITAP